MSLRDVKAESSSEANSSGSSSNANLSSIAEQSTEWKEIAGSADDERKPSSAATPSLSPFEQQPQQQPQQQQQFPSFSAMMATSEKRVNKSEDISDEAGARTQLVVRPSRSEEGWNVFADENEDSNHSLSEILPSTAIISNQDNHVASVQTQVSNEDTGPFDDYYLRMFSS